MQNHKKKPGCGTGTCGTTRSAFCSTTTESEPPAGRRHEDPLRESVLDFLKTKGTMATAEAVENALVILGDAETIKRGDVSGGTTFNDLLNDARYYPASVFGYYNPETGVLAYFSGAQPTDKRLKRVRFSIDFDRERGGEVINTVYFDGGPENPHLKALEGLQVSGGFAIIGLGRVNPPDRKDGTGN